MLERSIRRLKNVEQEPAQSDERAAHGHGGPESKQHHALSTDARLPRSRSSSRMLRNAVTSAFLPCFGATGASIRLAPLALTQRAVSQGRTHDDQRDRRRVASASCNPQKNQKQEYAGQAPTIWYNRRSDNR